MTGYIRVKVLCIIRRDDDVLLSFAVDPASGARYGRFLGGGVEPGERAIDAVRRELREELGADICDVAPLGAVENIYQHDGRIHHEVIFVFGAAFAEPALYDQDEFPVNEAVCDGPAEWVAIERLLRRQIAIYPPELLQLVRDFCSNPGGPRPV